MSEKIWFNTPVGRLSYPWLTSPDTKYDELGVYKSTLLLENGAPDVEEFLTEMTAVLDEFEATLTPQQRGEYARKPILRTIYGDDGETGEVSMLAKLRANVVPRNGGEPFSQSPTLVMADGTPVQEPIYSDTMASLHGHVRPYANAAAQNYGLSFRLFRVEVHDLVTGTGRSAESGTMAGHAS